MFTVSINCFAEWREQARTLLMRGVTPKSISWQHDKQSALVFDDGIDFMSLPVLYQSLSIPKAFITMAEKVACCRDDSRWALLYSLAWRILFENRDLMSIEVDSQVVKALRMRKAVGRDIHKMEAFVRFRLIDSQCSNYGDYFSAEDEYYVAWFEPDHLILPIAVTFFIKRFTNMSWSILTPDGCAHWNQSSVMFTEGIHKRPDIDDSIEVLWLTYYSNIFNPARVKIKAMQSEMPKKYWVNLPEAPLIKTLMRNAGHQVDAMLEGASTQPWHKTKKSTFVMAAQKKMQAHTTKNTS